MNKEIDRILSRIKPSIYFYFSNLVMAKSGLDLFELDQVNETERKSIIENAIKDENIATIMSEIKQLIISDTKIPVKFFDPPLKSEAITFYKSILEKNPIK